jgi:hypothetical protein
MPENAHGVKTHLAWTVVGPAVDLRQEAVEGLSTHSAGGGLREHGGRRNREPTCLDLAVQFQQRPVPGDQPARIRGHGKVHELLVIRVAAAPRRRANHIHEPGAGRPGM